MLAAWVPVAAGRWRAWRTAAPTPTHMPTATLAVLGPTHPATWEATDTGMGTEGMAMGMGLTSASGAATADPVAVMAEVVAAPTPVPTTTASADLVPVFLRLDPLPVPGLLEPTVRLASSSLRTLRCQCQCLPTHLPVASSPGLPLSPSLRRRWPCRCPLALARAVRASAPAEAANPPSRSPHL